MLNRVYLADVANGCPIKLMGGRGILVHALGGWVVPSVRVWLQGCYAPKVQPKPHFFVAPGRMKLPS
ncbi:hypothetical protein A2V68_01700 [candidate division Kazan bacterium RBG_13_50_9]|uniref:Uncharacterized protein n=1 Tax=candidate division Kazan bacterium RBG_13_50_9 TaxID=1798535 RepID=A0A1F4NSX7_UNCK3|nr:MAG: hypothetical protein A2V68_01700 [candidate division Kazan bacterium RBG_13_50_9]